MSTSGPEQPYGANEYPSLENSGPPPDPNTPLDYPTNAGLPPPIYPPPQAPGYPGAPVYPAPGYYGGGDRKSTRLNSSH